DPLVDGNTRLVERLEELLRDVANLEIAYDAAATTAMAAKLGASIRAFESELESLQRPQSREQSLRDYFGQVQAELVATQASAVAGYTTKYGPVTSVIQRRLRSVCGFGDITLHPVASRIDVRVARNGELLLPTEFFSQSQQQILILSLFMTACITQT